VVFVCLVEPTLTVPQSEAASAHAMLAPPRAQMVTHAKSAELVCTRKTREIWSA